MTTTKATEAPRNGRAFLIVFLALLSAFGPFVTDFYLPTLPEQTADFGAPASLVQLGLSATMCPNFHSLRYLDAPSPLIPLCCSVRPL